MNTGLRIPALACNARSAGMTRRRIQNGISSSISPRAGAGAGPARGGCDFPRRSGRAELAARCRSQNLRRPGAAARAAGPVEQASVRRGSLAAPPRSSSGPGRTGPAICASAARLRCKPSSPFFRYCSAIWHRVLVEDHDAVPFGFFPALAGRLVAPANPRSPGADSRSAGRPGSGEFPGRRRGCRSGSLCSRFPPSHAPFVPRPPSTVMPDLPPARPIARAFGVIHTRTPPGPPPALCSYFVPAPKRKPANRKRREAERCREKVIDGTSHIVGGRCNGRVTPLTNVRSEFSAKISARVKSALPGASPIAAFYGQVSLWIVGRCGLLVTPLSSAIRYLLADRDTTDFRS